MANGFCARNHWLRHQVQPEAAATILVTAVFVAKEGAEVEASALPLASTAAHSPPVSSCSRQVSETLPTSSVPMRRLCVRIP